MMFWELYQQSQISSANSSATRAESKASSTDAKVRRLEEKVDMLALTCQAMWELLRDRTDLTEEELTAKVSEVDLRDGTADHRMGSVGSQCTSCDRPVSGRHSQCMYCGTENAKQHVFQT